MRTAILILALMVSGTSAFAQYSVVSEAEYKTACGVGIPAPMRARVGSYRVITETRSMAEGSPATNYHSRSVISYEDRAKWHSVRESTFGTTKKVSEEISFDGKTYVKDGAGGWVENPPKRYEMSRDPAASDTRYIKIEYRLLPNETFKGQSVKVCEKYEVAVVKNTETSAETQRESTTRSWISDGGLLKTENSFRNEGGIRTSTTWLKTEWEIDPAIKITAPVVIRQ